MGGEGGYTGVVEKLSGDAYLVYAYFAGWQRTDHADHRVSDQLRKETGRLGDLIFR